MPLDAEGMDVVDVRNELAAVHILRAHAELSGELGVALVTAGPGITNTITGIAIAALGAARDGARQLGGSWNPQSCPSQFRGAYRLTCRAFASAMPALAS